MKLSLIALFLLAVAASAEETATNAVADKVQASITDLVDVEENVEDATSSRRRRRRWHAHHPHAHWPHGHRPHAHWPHGHRPHWHVPHGHRPHAHWPHLHWPALGKFFERAWDAFTGPFISFANAVASFPWAEIAGTIGRWTMRNILEPLRKALKYILDMIVMFGEMLWLIFSNPCKLSWNKFVDAMKRCWTINGAGYNSRKHSAGRSPIKRFIGNQGHAVCGTACTLVVIFFEMCFAAFNALIAVVLWLADSCNAFRGKNPTLSIYVSWDMDLAYWIYKHVASIFVGVGFDAKYNKFCSAGYALTKGYTLPPVGAKTGGAGDIMPMFALGTPEEETWANLFTIGFSIKIPLFDISFAFSLSYVYAKRMSKFRALGCSVKVGYHGDIAKVAISISVGVGKTFTLLCYLAGHMEGLTCKEHYTVRRGGGSNTHASPNFTSLQGYAWLGWAYRNFESSCAQQNGRLPSLSEMCPHGYGVNRNRTPVRVSNANDMWAPVLAGSNGNKWVQIGNRGGGKCNPLSTYHGSEGSWMTNTWGTSYKGQYVCLLTGSRWASGSASGTAAARPWYNSDD